jgi:hypothetical protein
MKKPCEYVPELFHTVTIAALVDQKAAATIANAPTTQANARSGEPIRSMPAVIDAAP